MWGLGPLTGNGVWAIGGVCGGRRCAPEPKVAKDPGSRAAGWGREATVGAMSLRRGQRLANRGQGFFWRRWQRTYQWWLWCEGQGGVPSWDQVVPQWNQGRGLGGMGPESRGGGGGLIRWPQDLIGEGSARGSGGEGDFHFFLSMFRVLRSQRLSGGTWPWAQRQQQEKQSP